MIRILMVLFTLAAVFGATPAHAAVACTGDGPTLRALPAALVGQAEQTFGLQSADAAWVKQSTFIRCMGGQVWACNVGANLPCGKANRAASLPAGDDWCRQNPNSDFIPAYISGHNSVWQWHCVKGAPATNGPPAAVDAQGYLVNYWKILN